MSMPVLSLLGWLGNPTPRVDLSHDKRQAGSDDRDTGDSKSGQTHVLPSACRELHSGLSDSFFVFILS